MVTGVDDGIGEVPSGDLSKYDTDVKMVVFSLDCEYGDSAHILTIVNPIFSFQMHC
jgi:hypothetical protein